MKQLNRKLNYKINIYSKEEKKYYNFFMKEIFTSDGFYMRKYTLPFYEQCFQIFSFNFLIKNNFFSDFCLLFKDKVPILLFFLLCCFMQL